LYTPQANKKQNTTGKKPSPYISALKGEALQRYLVRGRDPMLTLAVTVEWIEEVSN
jgi:hypothetical protein